MTAGRGGGRRHDRNGDLRSGSGGAVDRGRRHGFLCRPRPGWPRSRIQRMEKNSLAGHGCSGHGWRHLVDALHSHARLRAAGPRFLPLVQDSMS